MNALILACTGCVFLGTALCEGCVPPPLGEESDAPALIAEALALAYAQASDAPPPSSNIPILPALWA